MASLTQMARLHYQAKTVKLVQGMMLISNQMVHLFQTQTEVLHFQVEVQLQTLVGLIMFQEEQ